jgi:hypothetical protein
MPRVRVPRHVSRLVARIVFEYFADAARPGASARRATCRAARRRLLRPHRVSGCLSTSRGSSSTTSPHACRLVVNYFTSRRLVVDYFAYAARPGATARHSARRAARH